MIADKFINGIDLIVDEYDLNSCEKMIRIVLAKRDSLKQAEMVLIIEGSYKIYFEPKEDYIFTAKEVGETK